MQTNSECSAEVIEDTKGLSQQYLTAYKTGLVYEDEASCRLMLYLTLTIVG